MVGESSLLTCCPHLFWCSPGCSWPLGCEDMLLDYVIHENPSSIPQGCSQWTLLPVLTSGIDPTQIVHLALGLIKPHGAIYQACPSGWHPCLSTAQLSAVHAIFQLAFSLTVYVPEKDIKELWSQNKALRDTTRHWFPHRHGATKHSSLSGSRQTATVHGSNPCLSSLGISMLSNTMSKAL